MKSKKWIFFLVIVLLLVVAILLLTLNQKLPVTDNLSPTTTTTTTIGSAPSATTTVTTITTTTETMATTTTTTPPATSITTVSTTAATKVTAVAKTTATNTTKTTSGIKNYLDTSKLTGTQEDVGKVVGYNSLFKEEVTVVKVTEGVNNSGLKYIKTVFSDGTGSCVVECEHCHEFPCPDGGGEACSEYDAKLDGRVTCQQCGHPKGDGHNGTCRRTIDWDNGGKVICHHYD